MKREEIIFELAQYCHQDMYKGLIEWPTPALRALLDYYKNRPEQVVSYLINVSPKGEILKDLMKFND